MPVPVKLFYIFTIRTYGYSTPSSGSSSPAFLAIARVIRACVLVMGVPLAVRLVLTLVSTGSTHYAVFVLVSTRGFSRLLYS